jgi:phosphoglycerate kinase
LKNKGAIVTVCSHLGRPDGKEDKFSLAPCAERMSELLGQNVILTPDCIGEEAEKIISRGREGDVIMLENTRYYKEETKNEAGFVEKLARPFDLFVNDAFRPSCTCQYRGCYQVLKSIRIRIPFGQRTEIP